METVTEVIGKKNENRKGLSVCGQGGLKKNKLRKTPNFFYFQGGGAPKKGGGSSPVVVYSFDDVVRTAKKKSNELKVLARKFASMGIPV